jgi:methyl-accepting chemotaxis protein
MKFGKLLEASASKDFPEAWQPYIVQYKQLKKHIHRIVGEIQLRNLVWLLDPEALYLRDAYEEGRLPISSFNISNVAYDEKDDETHPSQSIECSEIMGISIPVQAEYEFTRYLGKIRCRLRIVSSVQSNTTTITDASSSSRETVYELEQDSVFFSVLTEQLQNYHEFVQRVVEHFSRRIENLSEDLSTITSPFADEFYTWRRILKLFIEMQLVSPSIQLVKETTSNKWKQFSVQSYSVIVSC